MSQIKTYLRRAKWAVWGFRKQGFSDLRTSALVAVNDFEVKGGRLRIRGWVKTFATDHSGYSLLVKSGATVIYEERLVLKKSDAAMSYFGYKEPPVFGFETVLDYESNVELSVFLSCEIKGRKKNTGLGVLPVYTGESNGIRVQNPYYYGQEGYVDLGGSCFNDPWYKQPQIPDGYHVDIIVPVFNGPRLLESMAAGLDKTSIPIEVYFIDDCSTDPEVSKLLDALCCSHHNYHCVRSDENGGFVRSVNLGLSYTTSDVVLLNTDVQLPSSWLERLIAPILLDGKVASATPFTNSGTICSFPNFCKDNELAFGLTVNEIDSVFKSLSPMYTPMPTGVGFCMACSRIALDAVGVLDADAYGRGYGEENDWCQRAISKGFKNVMVENLFVFHNHGGSFMSDEKKRLIDEHLRVLSNRYPNYNSDVARYCETDPVQEIRSFAKCALFLKSINAEKVLYLTHDLGGGAESYLKKRSKSDLDCGKSVVTILYTPFENLFRASIQFESTKMQFCSRTLEGALTLVMPYVDKVVINELATYPQLSTALRTIKSFVEGNKIALEVLIHDYLMVCPTVNLIGPDKVYCRMPACYAKCNSCYLKNDSHNYFQQSIGDYRLEWQDLLSIADKVVVFSNSSKEILEIAFPSLNNVVLKPHQVRPLPDVRRKRAEGDPLTIGLLGSLMRHKGEDIVDDLIKIADEEDSPIRFILVGKSETPKKSPRWTETGEFDESSLVTLVEKANPDIFFFPSVWPETFSYVCSEIMELGFPLVTFDFGAQAEKASSYSEGLVVPFDIGRSELLNRIMTFGMEARRSYVQ